MEYEWVTPEEALNRSGLDPETLHKVISDRIIPLVGYGKDLRLPLQEVLRIAECLNPERFRHLRGKAIPISEAAERLGVHRSSVIDWSRKGYIRKVHQEKAGRRYIFVDEADVEYACALIRVFGTRMGRSVFPSGGRYGGELLKRLQEAAKKEGL